MSLWVKRDFAGSEGRQPNLEVPGSLVHTNGWSVMSEEASPG